MQQRHDFQDRKLYDGELCRYSSRPPAFFQFASRRVSTSSAPGTLHRPSTSRSAALPVGCSLQLCILYCREPAPGRGNPGSPYLQSLFTTALIPWGLAGRYHCSVSVWWRITATKDDPHGHMNAYCTRAVHRIAAVAMYSGDSSAHGKSKVPGTVSSRRAVPT